MLDTVDGRYRCFGWSLKNNESSSQSDLFYNEAPVQNMCIVLSLSSTCLPQHFQAEQTCKARSRGKRQDVESYNTPFTLIVVNAMAKLSCHSLRNVRFFCFLFSRWDTFLNTYLSALRGARAQHGKKERAIYGTSSFV